MRYLVTGAAGFIGSHLVDRLLAGGHDVVGLDSFDPFYDPELKRFYLRDALSHGRFRLVEGDIRDRAAWERAAEAAADLPAAAAATGRDAAAAAATGRDAASPAGAPPFGAVVHLAALAGVRPSIQDPGRYQAVNVGGTQEALEFARRHGIGRFLFGSSSSVYGERKEVPFSEEDRVDHPISPYAATKRAGELICHTYHHLFGLDVLCLRFFTVYGPRQRPDLAIHKFARLMARGEPIPRFGDGSSSRDYTYVDDILKGVVAGLELLEGHGGVFEIVNLGESETVRLSELIDRLAGAMGVEPRIEELPRQPGDVSRTYADVSKARRLLGYRPTTSLEEGIRRFVAWFREHEGRLT